MLWQSAQPVTRFDRSLQRVVRDMFDTMAAGRGSGLAAPQIGVASRVVVLAFDKNPAFPDCEPIPPTVLINPDYQALGDERELAWEGCLSVPDMRGQVWRYTSIVYSARDMRGRTIENTVNGFFARVLQHEIDHLNGIVYCQRLASRDQFGFVRELQASGRMDRGGLPCEDPPADL